MFVLCSFKTRLHWEIKTRICSRQSNEHSCHDLAAEPFRRRNGQFSHSPICHLAGWPFCSLSFQQHDSQVPDPCALGLVVTTRWLAGSGSGHKEGTRISKCQANTHKYRTQWKYYKYTLSGVWLLCQDLLALMALHRWFFGSWIQVYSLQCTVYTIVKYKYTNSQKLESLIRSKGSLQPCVWLAV